LILRAAVLALPLAGCLVGYLVCDPFKVLRFHQVFYDSDPIALNRDFVSTEEFMRAEGTRPNAFIFGSSRSLAFHCEDWQRYLPADARPFHFDAWLESVYGVLHKVEFLDRRGVEIRDALLVLDAAGFDGWKNNYSHMFITHPAVSGESRLAFQALFAGSFFANLFFVKYYDYKLNGTIRPYMLDVFDAKPVRQFGHNDLLFQAYEDELAQGEDAYYARRRALFVDFVPKTLPPFFGPAQTAELVAIGRILAKQHTRVRVIVGPPYDQATMAAADRALLDEVFGRDNVFDFSGINVFNANHRNYYELSHFRPPVARELMRIAYASAGSVSP
jgi:hypothetical protein